jgi:hypothetical protein
MNRIKLMTQRRTAGLHVGVQCQAMEVLHQGGQLDVPVLVEASA